MAFARKALPDHVKPYAPNDSRKNTGAHRPSVYSPGMDHLVYNLRLLGATAEMIADTLSVEVNTLYTWRSVHVSFDEAWRAGGELADGEVARAMFHRAKGYSHRAEKIQFDREGNALRAEYIEHYPPDTSAGIFWLVNRRPMNWKQKQTTELSGPDGQPLAPPSVTIIGVEPGED
jgi:hypothetical protein